MLKVIQISSLYYCAFVEGDDANVVSQGYPTYEQCFSMMKMYEN